MVIVSHRFRGFLGPLFNVRLQCFAWLTCVFATLGQAAEHLTLNRDGTELHVSGKVVVEADNGGLLLCAPDGNLWLVQPDEIVGRRKDDQPFKGLTHDQFAEQLLAELPANFHVHKTAHYLICYNTSKPYAEWCGALFERLFRGFNTYWSYLGIKPSDPPFPLVAIVFDSKESYARYARANNGIESAFGYYNPVSNHMIMYDLTGVEGFAKRGARLGSTALINRVLSQPGAEHMVATIVHEATHQLAYNSGLQARLAANPFWVSEGLAIFFEAPDLKSSKGWRGIGNVNQSRLFRFRAYLKERPRESIVTLLANDTRFRAPTGRLNTYAEAWALTYYLIRTRKKDYVKYLKMLGQKAPIVEDDAETRIAEFKAFFGSDLAKLDAAFVRYMSKLR